MCVYNSTKRYAYCVDLNIDVAITSYSTRISRVLQDFYVRYCTHSSTGAGALLRNHLEETALPFELELAFLTTKKLIKKLPSLGGSCGTNTQGGRPAAPWDLAPWLAGS